jgi:hypothetical protein
MKLVSPNGEMALAPKASSTPNWYLGSTILLSKHSLHLTAIYCSFLAISPLTSSSKHVADRYKPFKKSIASLTIVAYFLEFIEGIWIWKMSAPLFIDHWRIWPGFCCFTNWSFDITFRYSSFWNI